MNATKISLTELKKAQAQRKKKTQELLVSRHHFKRGLMDCEIGNFAKDGQPAPYYEGYRLSYERLERLSNNG